MPSSKSSSVPSNPNPRTSEISNPMRRSFTGNPFAKPSVVANPRTNFAYTPANSPSDFPRRSSVGVRESIGSLRDCVDDKENGKDQILKGAKVRSPAVCSKAAKNFMSPTISASCKIAESPKKKVLAERNEPVPSFVPSPSPKSHTRKVTFAEPLEEKFDALVDGFLNFEEISQSSLTSEDLSGETVHDSDVTLIPNSNAHSLFETDLDMNTNDPLIPNNDTDLSFETVSDMNMNVPLTLNSDIHTEVVVEEPDCVNLDPTFKLSPAATPPVSTKATAVAPLDADPLMPPYDPKTNYLSPRPQFLHYKPKPRMELGRQTEFEDSLMSGSVSDTEITEDAESDSSQKESEEVSSNEDVMEEESHVSEPSPAKNLMPERKVEAKEVLKPPHFSMRAKAFALILLLSVAFASISVTDSPVIDHTLFEDFYKVYESSGFSEFAMAKFDQFSQFAIANFEGLAQSLHIWFTKSLFSVSELISDVRGVHNVAQLQYFNLTLLHDHDQYPRFGRGENEISDAASDIGTGVEDISAEQYEIYEEQVHEDMGIIAEVENDLYTSESEEVLEDQAAMVESEQVEQQDEAGNFEAELTWEVDANSNVENAPESATVIEPEQQTLRLDEGNSEAKQTEEGDSNFNAENQPSSNLEAAEIHIEGYGADNILQQAQESDAKQTEEGDSNFNAENQPSSNLEAAEIHIEGYGADNILQQAQETDAKFNVDEQSDLDLDSEVDEIHTAVYDDKAEGKSVSVDAVIRGMEQLLEAIDTRIVLYSIFFAVTVLIAAAAFNWSRKGKSRSKIIAASVEQPLPNKELHTDPFPSQTKLISPEKPSLRNGPIEMDMLGEPCPSEMSSYQYSSSYSKKVVNQLDEAQSVEKKRRTTYRRESLASSDCSMGSQSYGSLTVYEKIPSKPSKQGRGDGEIVTPVRRSSRIRNQATSPLS